VCSLFEVATYLMLSFVNFYFVRFYPFVFFFFYYFMVFLTRLSEALAVGLTLSWREVPSQCSLAAGSFRARASERALEEVSRKDTMAYLAEMEYGQEGMGAGDRPPLGVTPGRGSRS
jgi:hypothetical protein